MASSRTNFGDILEPGFRKIFNDSFVELPLVFPRIFRVNTSDKQDEFDSGVTGFSQLDQTTENQSVVYEDPVQMFDVTYTHQKYTKGFKISEELMEDDLYNVMRKKPAQLGRAARRTAENSAANVFNNAFSTSSLGGDSKPLASTTHPRSDGGTAQSNASSTGITLTDDNLEAARIAIRKQLDDKGQKISIRPRILLVPIDLEKDAVIITKSDLRPGTADNDVNIFKGMLDVISWEYISSTTAWWLLDPQQHQVTWFWRVRPEFKQDTAFDTGQALFKTRTRFSNGWSDWRGVWGSQGDGAAYSD